MKSSRLNLSGETSSSKFSVTLELRKAHKQKSSVTKITVHILCLSLLYPCDLNAYLNSYEFTVEVPPASLDVTKEKDTIETGINNCS